MFKHPKKRPVSLKWLGIFLLLFLSSSCANKPEAESQRSEHLKTSFDMVCKAVQDPSLHTMTKSIEEIEYSPGGVLDVMFSAYGAGTWPPPDAPKDIRVVRDQPAAAWTVTISSDDKSFQIEAFGEEIQKPEHQTRIDFLKPEDG